MPSSVVDVFIEIVSVLLTKGTSLKGRHETKIKNLLGLGLLY